MSMNQPGDATRLQSLASTVREHWMMFLVEGIVLLVLGLLAILIPPLATLGVTILFGWLFLISGAMGLIATFWARQAPGFWWSLVSAVLGIGAARKGQGEAQSDDRRGQSAAYDMGKRGHGSTPFELSNARHEPGIGRRADRACPQRPYYRRIAGTEKTALGECLFQPAGDSRNRKWTARLARPVVK